MLSVSEGVRLRFCRFGFALVALFLFAAFAPLLPAQSVATASRTVAPSAFGGLTGTYTGLNGGRNLGITAGLDVALRSFYGFSPAIEIRGTYPVDNGQVVGEKSAEGGLRLQKRIGRFRPYADFLFGRGEMNYQNGGLIVPLQAFRYIQTTTNVLSPGVGVEADVTPHFALLLDAQFQHWGVPYDPSGNGSGSGSIWSVPTTVGVVYRFNWLKHGHPGP